MDGIFFCTDEAWPDTELARRYKISGFFKVTKFLQSTLRIGREGWGTLFLGVTGKGGLAQGGIWGMRRWIESG
jgi:hypothetical protein